MTEIQINYDTEFNYINVIKNGNKKTYWLNNNEDVGKITKELQSLITSINVSTN